MAASPFDIVGLVLGILGFAGVVQFVYNVLDSNLPAQRVKDFEEVLADTTILFQTLFDEDGEPLSPRLTDFTTDMERRLVDLRDEGDAYRIRAHCATTWSAQVLEFLTLLSWNIGTVIKKIKKARGEISTLIAKERKRLDVEARVGLPTSKVLYASSRPRPAATSRYGATRSFSSPYDPYSRDPRVKPGPRSQASVSIPPRYQTLPPSNAPTGSLVDLTDPVTSPITMPTQLASPPSYSPAGPAQVMPRGVATFSESKLRTTQAALGLPVTPASGPSSGSRRAMSSSQVEDLVGMIKTLNEKVKTLQTVVEQGKNVPAVTSSNTVSPQTPAKDLHGNADIWSGRSPV